MSKVSHFLPLDVTSQEATDNFDPHGKLLGSNHVFPNSSVMWSPKIPIIGLAMGEVQNALDRH